MSMSISGVGAGNAQIWSGASMRQAPAQKMAALFQHIDTGSTGTISKAQFTQSFQSLNPPNAFKQSGPDAVWAKLDPNGSGSVSKQNFVSGMTSMMTSLRQAHGHASAAASAVQTITSGTQALAGLGTHVDTSA